MATSNKSKGTALVVDGSNYLFRAYYAVPQQPNRKDDQQTNAIRGFFNIVLADIREVKPKYMTIGFDRGTCWRHEEFPAYKAQRDRTKPELDAFWPQRPVIRKLLRACGLHFYYTPGIECDDIMGTCARKFADAGYYVLISTTDKDLTQLVRKNEICILEKITRAHLGPKQVKERMGVKPSKVVELLMLVGDSVDNIPGVPKVKDKTAIKLLAQYGDVETVLKSYKQMTPALSKNIRHAAKTIDFDLQRRLVTVGTDEPISFKPKRMKLSNILVDEAEVKRICSQYRLQSLREQLLDTLLPLNPKR